MENLNTIASSNLSFHLFEGYSFVKTLHYTNKQFQTINASQLNVTPHF